MMVLQIAVAAFFLYMDAVMIYMGIKFIGDADKE